MEVGLPPSLRRQRLGRQATVVDHGGLKPVDGSGNAPIQLGEGGREDDGPIGVTRSAPTPHREWEGGVKGLVVEMSIKINLYALYK